MKKIKIKIKIKIKKYLKIFSIALFFFCLFFVPKALAFKIEIVQNALIQGDYFLHPAKIEVKLEPGTALKRAITVENNSGAALIFKIETDDFKGSKNPETPVVLSGSDHQSSSKNWLKPETSQFQLKNGEKITMNVEISVPKNASPGGHYAVLVLSPQNASDKNNQILANSKIVSLFFIEVAGDFAESGFLKDFKITSSRLFFERKPVNFLLYFENNGLSHLTPSGTVEIKNIFGRQVEKFSIDPYFVLPDSLRSRKIVWSKPSSLGIFTATVSLNRGYKNIVDQKKIVFWILPRQIILLVSGLLIAAILVLFSANKKINLLKIGKFSIIILAAATLCFGFHAFAMESGNFKITEDSLDFGKTPGAADNYQVKDNKADIGVASAGQAGGKVLSFKTILLTLLGLFALSVALTRIKIPNFKRQIPNNIQ